MKNIRDVDRSSGKSVRKGLEKLKDRLVTDDVSQTPILNSGKAWSDGKNPRWIMQIICKGRGMRFMGGNPMPPIKELIFANIQIPDFNFSKTLSRVVKSMMDSCLYTLK